ncbi:hypothetical protein RJ639_046363 [Escallonia herrerae]|uniref:DUF295 domain-containing protein n=1 Tax=Escallonia herrerae TaxID=1293975 RepID=A0AA88W7Z5_9ASTE|nr:hypothetical protein RJ639_046363 [Escallonia herrerae]
MLFLRRNHSFSESAVNFPELRPNSIYFSDDLAHTGALKISSTGSQYGVSSAAWKIALSRPIVESITTHLDCRLSMPTPLLVRKQRDEKADIRI